jgi:hypothetical protein
MHLGSSGPVGSELCAFAGMVAPIAAIAARATAIVIRVSRVRITEHRRTIVCDEHPK